MSLPPHWSTMGAAWPPCSAMRHLVRRRTPMSTEALCPDPARVIGRLLSLLSIGRKSLMVTVCCPSPAPEPHWRTQLCSPVFEEDGMRVQIRFEGAETHIKTRCNRHPDGGRPSISVWCSHVRAPADGNEAGTRCQRRTTLGLKHSGKHWGIRS